MARSGENRDRLSAWQASIWNDSRLVWGKLWNVLSLPTFTYVQPRRKPMIIAQHAKLARALGLVAIFGLGTLGLAACDDSGPAEEAASEAGAAVDDAVEATGEAVEDAGEAVQEAVD